MANAELLIAHRGATHVLPELRAQVNQAQYGADNYVFPFANNFSYTIVDNTHVTIKKGIAMIQGRPAILSADVTLVIENGSTNYFRKDLICMRLERIDGIENANAVVIKGTAVLSGAVDPTYNTGDFNTTVNIVDYPLLRVNVNGLVIGTVNTLFTVKTTIDSLKALVDSKQPLLGKGFFSSGNLDVSPFITAGTYDITGTTLTNQPVAIAGQLTVFAATAISPTCQIFITNGANSRIFHRTIGNPWVELSTTQSKKCGTFTNKTGQGDSLFLLFTLAELRNLFGDQTKTQANFVVTGLTNGNSAQTGNIFSGTVWVTTNLYVQMSASLASGAPLTVGYEITMC